MVRLIAERVPGAAFVVLPTTAHLVNAERLTIFNETLARHLEGAERHHA